MSQQPSESPIFPSEITVSDGEESQKEVKEVLPFSSRSDMLRRSQKLQQGDKDLEIFCLEQELEAIKEENIKLKLTTKSQQESISVLSHKIHQLETAKSQGEKWFGDNEQFSYVTKRGIQALAALSQVSRRQKRIASSHPDLVWRALQTRRVCSP